MKRRYVIVLFIILLSLLVMNNIPHNKIFKFSNSKDYTEQSTNNYNKMKIDSVNLKSRITGTEPFNSGEKSNSDGVDVSDSDDYVRTFDYVKYILELSIVPNTLEEGVNDSSSFSGGIIKVKAKLPNQGDMILMTWEKDAWMKNVSFNEDKTELYAEYHVSNDIDITHANQELSFTFKINGYKKDITDDMAPEFEVWMDGNKPDDYSSTVDSFKYKNIDKKLIISAKPSYDVDLKASTYLYPAIKDEVVGQYVSYGIGVALIQPYSYIKDLRGVEYPTGKFEVELNNTYSAKESNSNSNYSAVTNNSQMVAYSVNYVNNNNYYPTSRVYTRNLPKGIGGGENGVTNSGTMNASFENSKTIISFNNYTLDNKYPIRNLVTAKDSITYPDDLGYIMAGNIQLFVPFYDNESDISYDYSYDVNISKIKYYDTNGNSYIVNSNDEQKTNNNKVSITFDKKNNGQFYVASNVVSNNTVDIDGLASALSGTYIEPRFTLMPATGPYDSAERLIVWNNNYFELVKKSINKWVDITCGSELGFSCNGSNNFELKYGIYKDNNEGIISDDLVNSVYFDDFDWYDTPEEALTHGKISAIYGIDSEVLGNRIHRYMFPKFKVIDNSENIGKVGMIVHRTRIYDINKSIVYEPYKNNKYTKTTYDDEGNLVKKHSSYNIGLSVLILGNKTSVTTTTTDTDSSKKSRNSYDVTDGEINLKVVPKLENEIKTDSYSDSVIVETTLPKGLNYKEGSANKEPKEVTIDDKGITTIVWEYKNWKVNSDAPEYPEILFKAEISASVTNNASLTISSTIFDDKDTRDIRYRNSNYTIFISNLSGSNGFIEINKNTLDENEDFNIENVITNISLSKLENIYALEILPKSGNNGTYKIKVLEIDNNQKLYYTTKSIDELNIEEDINGKKIIKEFDETLWNEVEVNDEIEDDATAILSIMDSIDSFKNVRFKYNIIPSDNKIGDTYSFYMNITSSNFISAVKTNTVVAQVVDRKISGIAFIDTNSNDKYDTEDDTLKNIEVELLDENNNVLKTSKTDESGNYYFDGLSKGKYFVKFIIPKGYKTLPIDDNKANSNGLTNIINHTEDRIVNNVNLGVERKNVNVVTHYYYDNTTDSISNDVKDEYLYGQHYETKEANNIPINYELKTTTNNVSGTANEDNIEVIYFYKMKDSIIDDSISKSGSEVINSKDEYIDYEIDYHVSINDYIGDATITIEDKLPFDIDIDYSELDGGVYNEEDRTITWNVNISNIDTYKDDFDFKLEKNIKVAYKDLDVLNSTISNNVIGTIKLSNNNSVKKSSFDTIVEIPSTIVEHYYRKNTTDELKPSVRSIGYVGQRYVATPQTIEGYDLVEEPTEQYVYEEEEKSIVHEYVKKEDTKKENNPKTNDNIIKYIVMFSITLIIVITVIFILYKKNRKIKG